MMTAVAAAVESPSPSRSPLRQRCRLGSPVLAGGIGSGGGEFDIKHWRQAAPKRSGSGIRRRWAPPEIEIPNGGGAGGRRGYTSLRDIMSSPEYAAAASKSSSPAEYGSGGGGSCGDVHMIRNPLVKHAAYAYLQLTPSGREDDGAGRRRRRRRGPLCRLLVGCLGCVAAFFGR